MIKKYHVSKNLFDKDADSEKGTTTYNYTISGLNPNLNYTCSTNFEKVSETASLYFGGGNTGVNGVWAGYPKTFKPNENGEIVVYVRYVTAGTDAPIIYDSVKNGSIWVMVNEGSTALPYEPYGNTWTEIPYKRYETSTDTLTTLPAEVIADGNNATVGISGNMSQTGTPTPQNPIEPSECGERTGNLFDKSTLVDGKGIDANGTIINYSKRCTISVPINVSEFDDVTISFASDVSNTRVIYALFNGSTLIRRESAIFSGSSIDVSSGNSLYICFYETTDLVTVTSDDLSNIMLNTGSTPLPYEPYGYKIPILSGGTTTPIYLGEVQSTRQIKKLVLTGDEAWGRNSGNSVFYLAISDGANGNAITSMCTEYPAIVNVSAYANMADKSICIKSDGSAIWIRDTDMSSAADFKTHLSQQYAAGTPVCVWYVLATPTTGIVNEPIRKIGEYADTVSGISVPTLGTSEQFDVDTTLKPSEVSLAYTGWHNKSDTKF